MTQQSTSYPGSKIRLYLGSALLFICIFTTATLVALLIFLCILGPFSLRYKVATAWCSLVVWMTKFFCGLGYEVEGLEHIKELDAAIVLSKHQSAWETLALRHILPPQTTLLKRSLLWMPLWGWALATLRPIAIDRENQRAALRKLLDEGTACLHDRRRIFLAFYAWQPRLFHRQSQTKAQHTFYPLQHSFQANCFSSCLLPACCHLSWTPLFRLRNS